MKKSFTEMPLFYVLIGLTQVPFIIINVSTSWINGFALGWCFAIALVVKVEAIK